ncbi:MAG: hypothetical protein QM640_11210 [Niabella sp.]
MQNMLPTFIINLDSRPDRRANVLTQFNNRNEFKVNVVSAVRHDTGAIVK